MHACVGRIDVALELKTLLTSTHVDTSPVFSCCVATLYFAQACVATCDLLRDMPSLQL